MRKHRVEHMQYDFSDSAVDQEIINVLSYAIVEQALLDYKNVCRWLTTMRPTNKNTTMNNLDMYYSIREFFNSGCNGMVEKPSYSLAYVIDERLMREEGIDTDRARRNADLFLKTIGKEYASQWLYRTRKNDKKEEKFDGRSRKRK